jgi:hypothetical protein
MYQAFSFIFIDPVISGAVSRHRVQLIRNRTPIRPVEQCSTGRIGVLKYQINVDLNRC